MSMLVRDVRFWDPDAGTLHTGDLLVDDAGLRPADRSVDPSAHTVVDGRGRLALPGLVCAHHHIYSALARGMPAPPRTPRNFAEILDLVWWRLDRRLDHEMIRASALAAALDCVRCGVTRIIDHHASPNALGGCLDVIADAFDEVGVSYVLCYELSDRDGADVAEAGLAETARYLGTGRPGLVGLHASFTVGDELLEHAVALAERHGVGLHLHVAEDPLDQDRCLADHGCRVIQRLHTAGALDRPGTLLAHCLHLDDEERRLVAASPSWVVQNTESNQNNAVGRFRREGFAPERLLLGTDGMHGDMLRSMHAAFLDGRQDGAPFDAAWRSLWNNQRYLQQHHPAAAHGDHLVLLDYPSPTPVAPDNLLGHAIYGLDASHVSSVIAGGRMVLDDGEITTVDTTAVQAECHEQARRLWSALKGTS